MFARAAMKVGQKVSARLKPLYDNHLLEITWWSVWLIGVTLLEAFNVPPTKFSASVASQSLGVMADEKRE